MPTTAQSELPSWITKPGQSPLKLADAGLCTCRSHFRHCEPQGKDRSFLAISTLLKPGCKRPADVGVRRRPHAWIAHFVHSTNAVIMTMEPPRYDADSRLKTRGWRLSPRSRGQRC